MGEVIEGKFPHAPNINLMHRRIETILDHMVLARRDGEAMLASVSPKTRLHFSIALTVPEAGLVLDYIHETDTLLAEALDFIDRKGLSDAFNAEAEVVFEADFTDPDDPGPSAA